MSPSRSPPWWLSLETAQRSPKFVLLRPLGSLLTLYPSKQQVVWEEKSPFLFLSTLCTPSLVFISRDYEDKPVLLVMCVCGTCQV